MAEPTPSTTTTLSGNPGLGIVGTAYDFKPTVNGSTGTQSWALQTGSLPAGVSLNATTGEITGTPTTAGSYTFTLRMTDSSGYADLSVSNAQVVAPVSLSYADAAGPFNAGANINLFPTVTGGSGNKSWAISGAANLPGSLSINPGTGLISGSIPEDGTYSFSVAVTDDTGTSAANLSFSVQTPVGLSQPQVEMHAIVGVAFSYAPTIAQGSGTGRAWAVTTGNLPTGLQLDSASGTISGTPTVPGNVAFTLTVTDSTGSASQQVQLDIVEVKITLPGEFDVQGIVNKPLRYQLTSTDGDGEKMWSMVGTALPAGITLNEVSGLLTGEPVVEGNFECLVGVSDDTGDATAILKFEFFSNIALTGYAEDPIFQKPYSFIPDIVGGQSPSVFSIVGKLADGIVLNTETGELSGSPTTLGQISDAYMKVVDANGTTAYLKIHNTVVDITEATIGDSLIMAQFSDVVNTLTASVVNTDVAVAQMIVAVRYVLRAPTDTALTELWKIVSTYGAVFSGASFQTSLTNSPDLRGSIALGKILSLFANVITNPSSVVNVDDFMRTVPNQGVIQFIERKLNRNVW